MNNQTIIANADKNLPYSLESEQAVLGCILIDPSVLGRVALLLKADYFYLPQHKAIFLAMLELDASGNGKVDALLLLELLRNQHVFSEEDGKEYLVRLAEFVPTVENLESYCKIIKDKYYVRTLITVSGDIINMAYENQDEAEKVLDTAEQRIYDIRQGKAVAGPAPISDVISDVYDRLNKLNSPDKELYKGLPTGFPDFDKMVTGLNRSDLVLIGARPAMGKTSFALNLARNVAVKGKRKVVFFSLEMSKEQLAQRVISTEARIPSQKMRTGDLTPQEWESLSGACVFLADIQLYFDDTANITVPEMKARIRQLKNVDCVFIDYLQLMQGSKKTENRVQEVSEITRSLKLMAKDLNIPVVVCAQLSRSTEGRGHSHKPQLADLRESGSIEQDADIVVMLYRDDYYKDEKDNPDDVVVNAAELLVQKNRHGPTGSIKMAWNPKFTLYTCVEQQHDEA